MEDRPKGHPLKDGIEQENASRQKAFDADFDRRNQVINDSLKDLGETIASGVKRFLKEVGEQVMHSTAHGASEVASVLSTGNAYVQYGASPAAVAEGEGTVHGKAEEAGQAKEPAQGVDVPLHAQLEGQSLPQMPGHEQSRGRGR